MTERADLLVSIAGTIEDYRAGELPKPTPDHVDRWVRQFDKPNRLPLLRELDHVLKSTYFSRAKVINFFSRQIEHEKLAGSDPCDFWKAAHLLDIQKQGHSQHEIRALFLDALRSKCGKGVTGNGDDGGAFIYLDDVLFSGSRIGNDLETWIESEAPLAAEVHILVIAAHRFGEWKCSERLKAKASQADKRINFHFWAAVRVENRRAHRHQSEVLWPAEIPDDENLRAYLSEEKKFPFEPRAAGGKLEHNIFSSEEGRRVLERELLLAGMRIRSFSQNPSRALRPLGFSPFGVGFGSMVVTYRNCPNNCPLALWWGDPNASANHPFSRWYPLVPRKTYAAEVDFDAIDV